MEEPHFSQDDITDVLEMTNKLEDAIGEILGGQDKDLAVSALMNAFINCLFMQCKSMDAVLLYERVFIEILNDLVRSIQIPKAE